MKTLFFAELFSHGMFFVVSIAKNCNRHLECVNEKMWDMQA